MPNQKQRPAASDERAPARKDAPYVKVMPPEAAHDPGLRKLFEDRDRVIQRQHAEAEAEVQRVRDFQQFTEDQRVRSEKARGDGGEE